MGRVRSAIKTAGGWIKPAAIGLPAIALVTFVIACARDARRLFELATVTDTDRLQFYGSMLGALVGAFAAIVGAVWIEDAKRARERSDRTRPLREALQLCDRVAKLATEADNAKNPVSERKIKVGMIADVLGQHRELIEFARGSAAINDIAIWIRLKGIDKLFDEFEDQRAAIAGTNFANADDDMVESASAIMSEFCTRLQSTIAATLRQMDDRL